MSVPTLSHNTAAPAKAVLSYLHFHSEAHLTLTHLTLSLRFSNPKTLLAQAFLSSISCTVFPLVVTTLTRYENSSACIIVSPLRFTYIFHSHISRPSADIRSLAFLKLATCCGLADKTCAKTRKSGISKLYERSQMNAKHLKETYKIIGIMFVVH